jgi:hypothetical protein
MGKLFWFVLGAVATVGAGIAAVLWEENKLTGRPYWYNPRHDSTGKEGDEAKNDAETSNQTSNPPGDAKQDEAQAGRNEDGVEQVNSQPAG